ncbi:MAG: hypothetical protein K2N52_05180 [Clostridia bacterium]|nr:hypothetical protein [Clostridia bacterium]
MAKKKFGVGNIVACVAALFGLVALVMLFVPQLNWKSITGYDKGDPLSGLQITFGYSEHDVQILNFSVGNFFTYLLVIVGIVFAVLAIFGKLGKIAPVISAVAFVAAGVLFFCALALMNVNVGELTGEAADKAAQLIKDRYTLGAGAIVGGVFALVSGAAMAGKLFIKK